MTEPLGASPSGLIDGIKENAKLAVISGVILIVAGTFAVMSPLVAGLSITILVGVSLVFGGVGQCFLALKAGAFGRALLTFLVGALMVVAGSFMMTQPVAGLASITLLLVAYLIAAGLGELIMSLQLRPADGWGWMLFNGIITLLLGMMLWRQYPLSGAWAIGVLFGIKMIFSGWALVFIGRGVKQAATSLEA
ncbi:MAG: hypothetical protein DRR11_18970 [Gammaproteobacteria bacterium]|jgi:uncharacterized membrane protein HdeD (DUF308 family)|nr:MAG: hypothetical protein DRR11_18970 [Gammaproteobacteria bacterium]